MCEGQTQTGASQLSFSKRSCTQCVLGPNTSWFKSALCFKKELHAMCMGPKRVQASSLFQKGAAPNVCGAQTGSSQLSFSKRSCTTCVWGPNWFKPALSFSKSSCPQCVWGPNWFKSALFFQKKLHPTCVRPQTQTGSSKLSFSERSWTQCVWAPKHNVCGPPNTNWFE